MPLDAQAVADAFGLGEAASLSEPLARGELGQVRRLVTDQGAWAVKESFEALTAQELSHADSCGAFQAACWEAGVPTPQPRRAADGHVVVAVGGEQLKAYAWVDLADPDPGLDPEVVGTLVAQLHRVVVPPRGQVHEWFSAPIGDREWRGVLKASRGAGAPYADRLAELLPSLLAVEQLLTPMQPVQTCHLDLWSDNLRRALDGGLCLIDFDNAGPGDPSRELAMVVVEFGRGDAIRQRRLHEAYCAAGGPGRLRGRDDFAMTVAQLHHIGHRHIGMWLSARDDEGRARSLAGIEEFLSEPLLLADVERTLGSVA
jgi:hypothetical protein